MKLTGTWPVLDGIGTLVAVVLSFLAFDDITTDRTATSFYVEYGLLLACASWCAIVAFRLFRRGHFIAGVASATVLTLGIVAQQGINLGTVPALTFAYVGTVGALLWFLGLSLVLIAASVLPRRGLQAVRS